MVDKPLGLTISTGLDALSHSMESIWNINANPVSASHAIQASKLVLENLPLLSKDLRNIELRSNIARACVHAGLAFSNTKTAIAHNLSYPVTLNYGIQHGIACEADTGFALIFQILSIEWDSASKPVEMVNPKGLSTIIDGSIIAFSA